MSEQPTGPTLGVGVVGAGWMGHLHARAYARLPHHYPHLRPRPRLVAVADTVPASLADAADRYGPVHTYADWRELVADPAVQAVSVTAPNSLHREIGVAVAEAGKHLWIEKPVGLTSADTQAVADAVDAAGVCATVGFNYRAVPAVARARRLVAEGALGRVTHARVRLFSDYAADPAGALSWRFQRQYGGSGVLNDLAVHGVDLLRFLVGDLSRVVADAERLIPRRPLAAAGASQYERVADVAEEAKGDVENDDYVSVLGRTTEGAIVQLEASRVAVGAQNDYGVEVQGDRGRLAWDFRRPGELWVSTGDAYVDQPVVLAPSARGDGDYAAFQPGAGLPLGFDDLKVAEAAAFVGGIAAGSSGGATLAEALANGRVLDAVAESVERRAWVDLT